MIQRFCLLLLSLFVANISTAQCVVINEILINGPGICDGACVPNTEEWTELYNTCPDPVDIGCYVLADGDFYVTIPSGTILQGHDYYVIGSFNSAVSLDLNLASCNCTGGSGVGIFTNSDEQLILFNSSGQYEDAVYWGSGQFPVSGSTQIIQGCSSQSYIVFSADGNFEHLPAAGSNGCTIARVCDGASSWEQRCNSSISANQSNGVPLVPDFVASQTTICQGSCINYSDMSAGMPVGWTWTFEGSSTSSSNSQFPANICYSSAGTFDVSYVVTAACGSYTINRTDYINVIENETPVILASGPLSFCTGGSVILSTQVNGELQWSVDNNPIDNATGQQLMVTGSGIYRVTATNGSCSATSEGIVVVVTEALLPQLTAAGSTTFCEGETVLLSVGEEFSEYTWMIDGIEIPGVQGNTLSANSSGLYSVEVSAGACSGISNEVDLTVIALPFAAIVADGPLSFCSGESVLLSVPGGFTFYQWLMNGVPIDGSNGSSASAGEEGLYEVIVFNGSCSYTTEAIQVTVIPGPLVAIEPDGIVELCAGSQVVLAASPGFDSYQWFMNGNILDGEITSTYTAGTPGTYYVLVSTGNFGCEGLSSEVSVQLSPPLSVAIQSSPESPCEGENVILSVPGEFSSYQWTGGATSSEITITTGGIYTVSVENDGCTGTDAIQVDFFPMPYVDAGADFFSDCENQIFLQGNVGENSGFFWTPAELLDAPNILDPGSLAQGTTVYTLSATLGNCIATDQVTVFSECASLIIPNVFTPNGDEANDFFEVLGNDITTYKMQIYNRWGLLLFESDNIEKHWDGNYQGNPVPEGTYLWIVLAHDFNGKSVLNEEHNHGTLSLLR